MVPFRTGDVVFYKGRERFWKGEHIIQDVKLHSPQRFEYATDKGAWMRHNDFMLVKEANKKSLAKLFKSLVEEGEM